MSDFFENVFNHVHGATTHFPIALLFVSVGMDYFAGKRPGLRSGAWLLLVLGTLGTIAAAVTGLVAHLPYEDNSVLLSAIDRHQHLGFAVTALFVGLTAWRWRSMRRSGEPAGRGPTLSWRSWGSPFSRLRALSAVTSLRSGASGSKASPGRIRTQSERRLRGLGAGFGRAGR